MTTKIARMTGIVIVLAAALSCSKPPAPNAPATLTFVIDDIADEEWSHFEDGSFEVRHTVTARVTDPADLRGRIVKVQINALAEVDTEPKIGTTWSVSLPDAKLDQGQLQTLVYKRISARRAASEL